MTAPRITIAVPSFNQGRFIGETLQSLVDQRYPELEVIIQDGGSTDGAVEIAGEFVRRFPGVFQLHVEPDTGHANAVNRAFRRSTGEVLGYLNTDDTLYPGCLERVAREIDPARGRFIVFGRCRFTGHGSPYVGQEHPAEFRGHFDLLAVWRRGYNTIPQPSTFWHRRSTRPVGTSTSDSIRASTTCSGAGSASGSPFTRWMRCGPPTGCTRRRCRPTRRRRNGSTS